MAPLLLVTLVFPLLPAAPLSPTEPLLPLLPWLRSDGVHDPPGRPTQLFG
jgi:hypothetical protein